MESVPRRSNLRRVLQTVALVVSAVLFALGRWHAAWSAPSSSSPSAGTSGSLAPEVPLVDPDGRVSFASPTAGRAPPSAYDIHQAEPRPIATQGRAGSPVGRGRLPSENAAEGTAVWARTYAPRPVIEQGRVGAPGSLPTPEEVEERTIAQAHGAASARGAHYVPRPVVQEGRVGSPGSLPTPAQVERSRRMARAAPGGKENEYAGRPLSDMGRAVPGVQPIRVSAAAYAAPGYAPRPSAELGRVSSQGGPRSGTVAPPESAKSGTRQLGRASALPAPPPPPRVVSRPTELGRVGAPANPSGTFASDPSKRGHGDLTNTGRVRTQFAAQAPTPASGARPAAIPASAPAPAASPATKAATRAPRTGGAPASKGPAPATGSKP